MACFFGPVQPGGGGGVFLTLARCSAFFCSVALSFLICLFSCCRMRSFSRSAGHRVGRGARREHRGVRSLIISRYEALGDVRLAWCQGLLGLGCWLGRCGCRLCRRATSAEAGQHMLLCWQVSRVRVGMRQADYNASCRLGGLSVAFIRTFFLTGACRGGDGGGLGGAADEGPVSKSTVTCRGSVRLASVRRRDKDKGYGDMVLIELVAGRLLSCNHATAMGMS